MLSRSHLLLLLSVVPRRPFLVSLRSVRWTLRRALSFVITKAPLSLSGQGGDVQQGCVPAVPGWGMLVARRVAREAPCFPDRTGLDCPRRVWRWRLHTRVTLWCLTDGVAQQAGLLPTLCLRIITPIQAPTISSAVEAGQARNVPLAPHVQVIEYQRRHLLFQPRWALGSCPLLQESGSRDLSVAGLSGCGFRPPGSLSLGPLLAPLSGMSPFTQDLSHQADISVPGMSQFAALPLNLPPEDVSIPSSRPAVKGA